MRVPLFALSLAGMLALGGLAQAADASAPAPGQDQKPTHHFHRGGWCNMSDEDFHKRMTAIADRLTKQLKLTDAESGKLSAIEKTVEDSRADFKSLCPTGDNKTATVPDILNRQQSVLQKRQEMLTKLQPAITDFYQSLNDDQRKQFDQWFSHRRGYF
ncbi:MAG TPA: Spy/CpxP family protein refolding chaperone [Dongiaceae bacterium]|jgi:hypothetical protein|nr:Spy/CpxP family protein refolding chaperone [Dongiaceae bacterium]